MTTPISQPISGLPYPVLSGKPGTTTFSNPPFHPNILNIGGSNTAVNPPNAYPVIGGYPNNPGSIQRGKFLTGNNNKAFGTSNGILYQTNFLYNPSTISETRAIDLNNGALPNAYRNQGDVGAYLTGLNSTVTFSLLFDRTYELWDSSYAGSQEGTYGARVDIESLYNLTGINQPLNTAAFTNNIAKGPNGQAETSHYNLTVQGPMFVSPCNLYFGAQNTWALSYYGFISEMDITWTHFNAAMIPVRCAVDITFTVLPINTSNYTPGLA